MPTNAEIIAQLEADIAALEDAIADLDFQYNLDHNAFAILREAAHTLIQQHAEVVAADNENNFTLNPQITLEELNLSTLTTQLTNLNNDIAALDSQIAAYAAQHPEFEIGTGPNSI